MEQEKEELVEQALDCLREIASRVKSPFPAGKDYLNINVKDAEGDNVCFYGHMLNKTGLAMMSLKIDFELDCPSSSTVDYVADNITTVIKKNARILGYVS